MKKRLKKRQTKRRRSLQSAFCARKRENLFLVSCLLHIASYHLASAEPSQIVLKNGATVQAEVIQRTDQRLVLDLGFSVLTVPTNQVESEATRDRGADKSPQIGTGQEAAAVRGDEVKTAVAKPQSAPPARGPVGPRKRKESKDIVEETEGAVVIVSNPSGMGAGFIVDPNGQVVTNHHIVRGERYNDVTYFERTATGKVEKRVFKRVEVQAYSMLLDCALLKIPAEELEGMELPYLTLADADSIRPSMSVTAVGNPALGSRVLDHTLSQGIISSTNRNFNDVLYLQTTAAVNPGNSGGPLLNGAGEVVGLVTFRAFFQEGLAFALPVWYLRLFLDNAKAYSPTQDTKNTGYRYHDPGK